jgi:ATP synthase, F1 delta subunit
VTSATAGSTGLADRYASALFELAQSTSSLDTVAAELQRVNALIDESDDLSRLLSSPVINRKAQWRAVDAILAAAEIGDLTRRFIGVVADNRRLFALPTIIAAFQRRLAEARGETAVEVVAAKALTPAQMTAITTALQKAVSKNIALSTRIDPALLGGLVVKVGSRMIDSSVRTKLNRLSLAIKGVA